MEKATISGVCFEVRLLHYLEHLSFWILIYDFDSLLQQQPSISNTSLHSHTIDHRTYSVAH